MPRPRRIRALLLALALAAPAVAAQDAPVDAELEAVRDRLAKLMPEVKRGDVRPSGATGLYEIRADHKFGYVTADGRYLLSGELVDMETGERITEGRRNQERLRTLARFSGQGIEFASDSEPVRWWITVFTDVDCEYCRQLHRQVPELNRLGIGVRYLFFSKYGAPSDAYKRAQAIWCQADRKAALDDGLRSGSVRTPIFLCKNPVVEQYLAAVEMNLRGTPVAIFPDGSLFYGSAKAATLLEALQERDALAAKAVPPTAEAVAAPPP